MFLVELVVLHGEELADHLLLVVDGDVALRPDTGQLKRTLVTELAGGQLLALGVLRDETDVDALHVDIHVVLFHLVRTRRFHVGRERAEAVPFHTLTRGEQLGHHRGQTVDDAFNDVAAVDRLVEGHALDQTSQRQGVAGRIGLAEPLTIRR